MIVYKALHYVKEFLDKLSDTQSRELTNSKTNLHTPVLRTSSGQKTFAYRGVCIWNNLSNETKYSTTEASKQL